eukprot:CAMPEP_0175065226 /NCGR_PEP_ID=MMETSP0052_2-20121109/15796_1 /TAXON_ID=51329 ORGANISM="Polytomella parva, Strain SAG 63-3" /NCGR_SAMPLE_ID=MMETSP0052_2 /ASSEMBLY_ACC=CAM_ASM_000194 /LENGTH=73 /DNA_ID=CAMNT_0016331715 /DNA_START=148 /DNA_END=369 /DNA_ORIENTATION=-
MNGHLAPRYDTSILRHMKKLFFNGRQRTEAEMLRELEQTFGSSKEAFVMMGDKGQRQHRKFEELVKDREFRTI